jgi:hypothetical protein
MKKSILIIGLSFLSVICFGQKNINFSDTTSSIVHSINIKKDSRTDLEIIGDETAEYLSTLSIEEKEWFKKTFLRERGTFTVPKEPITYPFKD